MFIQSTKIAKCETIKVMLFEMQLKTGIKHLVFNGNGQYQIKQSQSKPKF